MKKINFKQPKYIFPLVLFVPVVGLAYCLVDLFGGDEDKNVQQVATDRINMELPEAKNDDMADKLATMSSRYGKDDSYTAVDAIGTEVEEKEMLEDGYTDEELQKVIDEAQRKEEERKQMEELERRLEASQRRLPRSSSSYDNEAYNAYQDELARIQGNSAARMKQLDETPDPDEVERQKAAEAAQKAKEEAEKNRPNLVIKSQDVNSQMFNTVEAMNAETDNSPLIRAMIDKTTKAHEGTRLRFKLLDDVIIDDVKLPKGQYLYGTVSGFGQQRVKANITSVLVGSRFLKVDLSVYDNDGMEGFYVPSSAFRDFMKQAGAGAFQQNIQFDSGSSYGNEINGEAIALQALQNIYSAGTNAIQANIRKNKAKIKYSTVVYLINSQEAR